MSSMITADTIRKILSDNINKEYSFSREEAIAIMNLPEEDMPFLMEMAGSLRKKYKGNHVSIHLLTNARSGNCSQNCAYCAQSCRSKADIEKYKWVDDEKLYSDNAFVHDNHLSRHCIGLSGMKFTDEDIEELAEKIRVMKADGTHLCCSIGFLTEKQALILKEAGLDRINHNLNSSRSYYHNICTTHTYEQRVNNIHMLQRLGFEICSGGIIGMGESKEDIVDMLLDLREIQPEALPINFLLPIPGTPLEHADTTVLTPSYCMKVLCLARLLVPQSDIRCAAGREVYFKGREKELLSVVDSIFASGYLTADGQGNTFESLLKSQIGQFLEELAVVDRMADEQGIQLTSQDEDDINNLAEEYYTGLSKEDLAYMQVSKDEVLDLYRKYYRADKTVSQMTESKNLEVSDAEAKVIQVERIETDSREKAEELLLQASEEKSDFTSIAEKNSLNSQIKFQLEWGPDLKEPDRSAFALEADEISDIIEKDGRFYIQKCVNAYDQQATALRKERLAQKKKTEAFQEIYLPYQEKYRVRLDGDVWENIDFSAGEGCNSDNFFSLYHSYFSK